MKKGEKILLGITLAVGAVDILLANGIYLKKQGIVLRDMILTSIDKKTHRPIDEEAEVQEIPIE